ncbi:MAG: hypothetical protein A2729_05450 [Candidatus Buchananbacteria bacterium RIFCSPHIGHO2_01_FULL_39_14]|uniref:DUF4430 domain-containing protein n=2 Tax=Candidatus Buchananiibacteriota TaxID=1817903 RepID=A0A1G1YMC2_9BACT|nr:MAG: hypothetical protein A2729_05450 [Candidatus Buchananbacteria bacterium RIFCSPHIGHO2_01_FULL_39_14]OGY48388.1 MAG: hypothetical protein A3D39_01535 [Candidatus Buchananbacteria bacterium RIFCSPHIGHO2_02_FULL_39_17]OGY53424.1 MAG: hypothetical protein A2912_00680 [Candidatus Buchananbacteria bacterium RIFCSPLOWO2_01_FULL_40_23b]
MQSKTKRQRITSIFLIFSFFLFPVFVSADTATAVNYLKSQSPDAWITMALAAAGETNINPDHLKQINGNLATDYAKAILALASVNENSETFGNVNYISQLKTYFADNQFGSPTLLNDDFWSILALASVNQKNINEVSAAKDFILANQNPDGGFSYAVSGESDTNDTAAAVMALVEAGLAPTHQAITNALDYLKIAQNADGGFGYQAGNDSDSGSDAWVISAIIKVNQDPNRWLKEGKNPVEHLLTLQDPDGGFWWVKPGTSEWNNKTMTAFAVIAISGKTFPVGYYQNNPDGESQNYHLRLEGKNSTICETEVGGTTALDLIKNAALNCGYTYNITQESFGPYLRAINDEVAEGLTGWLYFVNHISPAVGAADYLLKPGDEVLWYFGNWGWSPTKISADKIEINPGETINLKAEYFNGTEWLPLPQAKIKINEEEKTANAAGLAAVTINQSGVYQVYLETPEFIRSDKIQVTVGDTISQKVGLKVEIDQTDTGHVGGDAIALVVSPNLLDFGKLKPGQTAEQSVNLNNQGTVALTIGAQVSGEAVFINGLKIEGNLVNQYQTTMSSNSAKILNVSLTVPANYLASGIKNGELIFWGTSQ